MKTRLSVVNLAATICVTAAIVFFVQVLFSGFFDTVNLRGHPLTINDKTSQYVSTRVVIRHLAFDLTNLKEKSAQDSALLKDTMDRLITADENQGKLSMAIKEVLDESLSSLKDQKASLQKQQEAAEALRHSLEDQSKALQKQAESLEEQKQEIQELKVDLTVQAHDQAVQVQQGALNVDGNKILTHGDPRYWRQRTFSHHGTFGFVPYSTYRLSPRKFATSALAALQLHDSRKIEGCSWHNHDGSRVDGDVEILYHMEHHYAKYETVVLLCNLQADSGKRGGYLEASVDYERVVLMYEANRGKDSDPPPGFSPILEAELPVQVAVCGPPMYSPPEARSLWEWMEWNRAVVGAELTVLYSMGVLDGTVMEGLRNYTQAGALEVVNVGSVPYSVWYYAQGMFMHDCMYRMAWTARWVLFVDLDEYVQAMPPHTVGSLLTQHADKAWVSHQAQWWSLEICDPPSNDSDSWQGQYGIERTLWHWPKPYCQDTELYKDARYCLLSQGHRKIFVDPRKVQLLAIHSVKQPLEGGADLNVETEMRHNHYKGINVKGRKTESSVYCKQVMAEGEKEAWWKKDTSAASLAKKVRECPFEDKKCVEELAGW